MNEIAEALKERALRFALQVGRFCRTLPDTFEGRHVRNQLFRCSTSTAANYHAACRARSHRDFVAKMGLVVEESDEAVFWLTFLKRAEMDDNPELDPLTGEARELLAIFSASAKTASSNCHQH